MTLQGLPYIPGDGGTEPVPLARYLPPLPRGIIMTWLRQSAPDDCWVLDPFGATPALSLEAARAGYRVIVASNNPIICFMIEVLASSPSEIEFQAAIAEIGSVRRGKERLETHLKSLYVTDCRNCSEYVHVDYFLWRRDHDKPFARYYHCTQCGDEGEYPISPGDIERLSIPGSDQLHRARAMQRCKLEQDELQRGVEEALNTYLSRPLYFLFNLINKLESLTISDRTRQLLTALIISVCDAGNTLWPWPSGRSRPRQLSTPPQFREYNLWTSLESAIEGWCSSLPRVSTGYWPNVPAGEGSITIYPGRLRDLLPDMENIRPCLPVMVVPRPSQAFWTLSAIWAGWLWGRDAMRPLKGALARRRYDWQWHSNALFSVFKGLKEAELDSYQFFSVVPEISPGFLFALVSAAHAAGFSLTGITLQEAKSLAQIVWNQESLVGDFGTNSQDDVLNRLQVVCEKAAVNLLEMKNEPVSYLNLYAAILQNLVIENYFPPASPRQSVQTLVKLQAGVKAFFGENQKLIQYKTKGQSHESMLWWFAASSTLDLPPLSDRIEGDILDFLYSKSVVKQTDLIASLSEKYPGLITPSSEFIQVCLQSYAEKIKSGLVEWRLYKKETLSHRNEDFEHVQQLILQIGDKLGYCCDGDSTISWKKDGEIHYRYHIFKTAAIGETVLRIKSHDKRDVLLGSSRICRNVLVVPGSRARLLSHRLMHDPRLAEILKVSITVIKYRHIRRLSDRKEITWDMWDELLDSDPVQIEDAIQMEIFGKDKDTY